MPRQARLDAPGTLHHVIARGIERRKIFLGQEDYEAFVQRIEKVISGGDTHVLAWSLLPNHFHLLLRSGEVGLSAVMRRLLTGYVVTFNRRHRRHGRLFQNRYKSIVCEEDAYLLELVRYIHLNPLRARVVPIIEALSGYAYSGHSALMGEIERPWQRVAEVLGHFGVERDEARRRYEEFVEAGVGDGRRPDLVGGGLRRSHGGGVDLPRRRNREPETAYDERILGSSEFVTTVLQEAEWERREILRRARRGLGIAELVEKAAEVSGLTIEEIRSGSRRADVVAARRALAQVAVGELGYPGSAVARYLGVAVSTVNRSVQGDCGPLAARLLGAISPNPG